MVFIKSNDNRFYIMRAARLAGLAVLLSLVTVFFLVSTPLYADGKVINKTTGVTYEGATALQDAINAAITGDILFIKKKVISNATITGSGSLTSLTLLGNEDSIVDGNHTGRVLTIDGVVSVLIEHLTIQHGQVAGDGGGISVDNGASLTLKHVKVIHNSSTNGDGGGIYGGQIGTLTIRKSKIIHNTALSGGGVYFDATRLEIDDSVIKHNSATGGVDSSGGGIFVTAPAIATIVDTNISHNHADKSGGGLRNTVASNTTLRNVKINSNTVLNGDGGGVTNDNGSILTVFNTKITKNSASNNGGGLYNTGSSTVANFTDSEIEHNTAASGGGIYSGVNADFNLTDSEVEHNSPNDIVDF